VPAILEHGVDWYKGISAGKSEDAGTKLMGFSGRVKNPGVWELPFGTTAREILEEYAGGMRDGLKFKAWQPGGAGTDLVVWGLHWRWPLTMKLAWFRWCVTWKNSSPVSLVAGVHRAAMVCRGV
jgi:NADH:ubiquinone oxidoreductase subunit F (NADH-binding)